MALTDDAHQVVRSHFEGREKRVAIDATCGNGFDTQFLAELGFERVIGFDIQAVAINATREMLKRLSLKNVELALSSHTLMQDYLVSEVDCVMFNFGYLPTGDKAIVTDAVSSVKAISIAASLLRPNGLISLMCYPGHPSGAIEMHAILDWLETLNQPWTVETHLAVSPKPTAPILYVLRR